MPSWPTTLISTVRADSATLSLLELGPQDAHGDDVVELPVPVQGLPPDPLPHEAGFLVAALGPGVEGIGLKLHPVQPQLVKGVAEHGPYRLGAVALPPVLLLPDHDPQGRHPVLPIYPVQAHVPDVYPRIPLTHLDRQEEVVFPGEAFLEPTFLLGAGHGLVHEQVPAHLGVVEPPHEAVDVLPLDRPQPHALSVDHDGSPLL